MYFTEIFREKPKPINESISFTIKNLVNYLKSIFKDISEYEMLQSNIDRMKSEFTSIYKTDKNIDKTLEKIVDKYAISQNKYVPIDVYELDKYFRLKDRIGKGNKVIDSYDNIAIYGLMYRSLFNSAFENKYGMMTIPYVLSNRYILFFQFDDKDIQNIYLVVAENMYNLESEIALVPLKFENYISKSAFKR